MLKLSRHAALLLGLAATSLFAQTPAVSSVNSTYSVALKTIGTATFTSGQVPGPISAIIK